MNNGERLIDILEHLLVDKTMSEATRETILFLLEDIDFSTDRVCRVTSLMVICQKIFEYHPDALIQMLKSIKSLGLKINIIDES